MPRKPGRRSISFAVTPAQLAAVTAEARRRDIDLSRLIHLALSQQVEGSLTSLPIERENQNRSCLLAIYIFWFILIFIA